MRTWTVIVAASALAWPAAAQELTPPASALAPDGDAASTAGSSTAASSSASSAAASAPSAPSTAPPVASAEATAPPKLGDVLADPVRPTTSDEMAEVLRRRREPGGDREGRTVWYGKEILRVDAITLGVGAVGAALVLVAPDIGAAHLGAALGGYLLAPAIVHLTQGRLGRAFASAALRVGLPSVLAFIGAGACGWDACRDSWPIGAGVIIGAASAAAIDAFALAYDDAPRIPTHRVRPLIDTSARHAVFGCAVTF